MFGVQNAVDEAAKGARTEHTETDTIFWMVFMMLVAVMRYSSLGVSLCLIYVWIQLCHNVIE